MDGIPVGAGEAFKLWRTSAHRRGHNQRIQKAFVTLHGRIACLENAGRLRCKREEVFRRYTMVRTPRFGHLIRAVNALFTVHMHDSQVCLPFLPRTNFVTHHVLVAHAQHSPALPHPRVVIDMPANFVDSEDLLRTHDAEAVVSDNEGCEG